MKEQVLMPSEMAAILDERDHLRRERQEHQRQIESLTREVLHLTSLFQVRSEHMYVAGLKY